MGVTRTLTGPDSTLIISLLAITSKSLFNSTTAPSLIPSTSLSSTSVPTINSTIADGPFSFIVPYNQSQECDIYGPLCQTGLITVGVDLTSTTTTTTLPCSAYLTAQKSYLQGFEPNPGAIFPFYPNEWKTGFGRSPECQSYAQAWEKRGEGGKYTFSNCGTNNAVVPASEGVNLPSQVPAGVLNQIPFQVYECCGNCSVDAVEVRLYYFPDETATKNCSGKPLNSTRLEKNPQVLPGANSIAILSGYTFTSPSAYLEIVGTAAVSDQCGTVGAVLTNPIIALPPGQLSTYSPQFPFTIGEKYFDPNGVIGGMFLGYANPLKTADLACPTFGLGLSTSGGTTYTTYGPPYLPIIIPPPQLLDLDPEWKRLCTGFLSNSPGLRSFAIFDPPRILTPAAGLFPPSPPIPAIPAINTPISKPPSKPPAQPAQTVAPNGPKATANPNPSDPKLSDPKVPPVKPKIPSPGEPKAADPKIPSSSEPKAADPKIPSPGEPKTADPKIPPPAEPKVPEPNKPADRNNIERPTTHPQRPPIQESNLEKSSNLGPVIISAFGGSIPQNEKPSQASIPAPVNEQQAPPKNPGVPSDNVLPIPFTPKIITVADQTFKADPTAISLAGATLVPGGAGIDISGTPISLAPSGTLFVGNSPIPIPQAPIPIQQTPPKPAAVFTVGDQTFKADPTGFTVAGSSLVPGGSPVVISGTPVSLGKAGELVIGSSSVQIADSKPAPTFTVGGQIFTANPSGFTVAGSTLLPGGAPINFSGTKVSLNQAGGLVIGSSTINLPSQTPTSNTLTFEGFTFTAGPSASAILVNGATLVPGGPGTTVSGTPISLQTGGNLVIGSKTINLPAQTPTSNTFTVDGLTLTAAPSASAVEIGGKTLEPGGPGIIISGTSISLQPEGKLVVGTKTLDVPTQTPSLNSFTVDGLTFTAAPSASAVIIDGTTLTPGGPGATISGKSISLQPGGKLVVGSRTLDVPTQTPNSNTFTVGSLTFTVAPSATAVAVDGTTLTPGGPGATISGKSISLQPDGNLIVGEETLALPSQTPAPRIFTTNGLTFTSESSDIVVDGTTLLPGGPGATISGTPVSVAPGGSLVVGSSTVSAQAFQGGVGRIEMRWVLVLIGWVVGVVVWVGF